jgi:hypothetical protein
MEQIISRFQTDQLKRNKLGFRFTTIITPSAGTAMAIRQNPIASTGTFASRTSTAACDKTKIEIENKTKIT